MLKTILRRAAIAVMALLIIIQFIPYGRNHMNPPVNAEPQWDSAETREMAARACFNCHSNQTQWPWYSNVAPVSWLLQRDVDEGREHLNFSEWNRPQKDADEAAEQVSEDEMPPWFYLPLHSEAQLSAVEKQTLIRGLQATLGGNKHSERKDSDESSEKAEDEH